MGPGLRVFTCCALWGMLVSAAGAEPAAHSARPDGGVLRWPDGSEVALLGVNYYPPFSIDYHNLKARGADIEQVIRDDLAHFARLGVGVIRLHCWDREISDRQGNLVDNEHLRLLDFLIAECKRQGIYSMMTPIAWWAAPEPGGFSDLFTMAQMTTDPEAWRLQCRYLRQYLEHVNRYTGLAYKHDPAIVALELINEPQYPPGTTDEQIIRYVDTLIAAVRETGCRKAVLYNPWGGRHGAAAASTLDGVTFGWYPTGLVSGGMLRGNYLSAVADYPALRDPQIAGMVKAVYEFDAADVPGSVMYPAMARALRAGGVQVAAMFQYDPTPLAAENANWQTHHLNLLYTPGKAVSLALAVEVFRRVPRLQHTRTRPGSTRFGDFRVDHRRDLAELVAEDAFIYTNDTGSRPPKPGSLRRVWGCGTSPVVSWPGTGAYFLDKLAPGVWKLQVYPDAVMVADPYTGKPGEKIRLLWVKHRLKVRLADLGESYRLYPCSPDRRPLLDQALPPSRAVIAPGEYVLVAKGRHPPARVRGVPFVCPAPRPAAPAAFCPLPDHWREGQPLPVEATVAAPGLTACRLCVAAAGRQPIRLAMRPVAPYRFQTTVPGRLLHRGRLRLHLEAEAGGRQLCFPVAEALLPPAAIGPRGGVEGSFAGRGTASWEVGGDSGAYLKLCSPGFAPPPDCSRVEWPVTGIGNGYQQLVLVARGGPDTSAVEVVLTQRDGRSYGTDFPLTTGWREISVPLAELQPRWQTKGGQLSPELVSQVRMTFGSWLFPDRRHQAHRVDIRALELRGPEPDWYLDVHPADAPVVLAAPGVRIPVLGGHRATARRVPGMNPTKLALRVAAPEGFEPAPDAAHFRVAVPETVASQLSVLPEARHLVVTARAGEVATDKCEVVIQEDDGTPWGTVVELGPEWREIRVPLAELQHFRHWNTGPPGRGKPGDHLRPSRVRAVSICFGAWLYGDRRRAPHALEIEEVALAR